jgi:hypothetical protein
LLHLRRTKASSVQIGLGKYQEKQTMDPVTTAIIAAAADLSSTLVKDSYNGLKNLIVKKWGAKSPVAAAVEAVEEKPDSDGRRSVLQEELTAVKAHEEPEVAAAAAKLIEAAKTTPAGAQVINNIQQNISGSHNAVLGSGTMNANFGQPQK